MKKKKEIKDIQVMFRLTETEKERLENLCNETNLTMTDLFRLVVLGMSDMDIKKIANGQYAITANGRILWS